MFLINLYSDLGNVKLIPEGSGTYVKYYAQLGADAASKKLLGKAVYDLGTGSIFDISQVYENYRHLTVSDFYPIIESFYARGGAKGDGDTGWIYTDGTGRINKTYNADTGILNIDGLNISNSGQGTSGGNLKVSVSMQANATVRVLLIL